jgi:TRAP-type C4-dicarboxylate transport system permease large subunit
MISEAIIRNISSPHLFLVVVNFMLLVIGCFFDGGAAMILLAPLLVPVAKGMDVDLIHFGVIMCINLTIAGFTPPFGSQMFTTCAIAGCKIEDYIRESLPFIVTLTAALMLISYLPQVTLLVPNWLS